MQQPHLCSFLDPFRGLDRQRKDQCRPAIEAFPFAADLSDHLWPVKGMLDSLTRFAAERFHTAPMQVQCAGRVSSATGMTQSVHRPLTRRLKYYTLSRKALTHNHDPDTSSKSVSGRNEGGRGCRGRGNWQRTDFPYTDTAPLADLKRLPAQPLRLDLTNRFFVSAGLLRARLVSSTESAAKAGAAPFHLQPKISSPYMVSRDHADTAHSPTSRSPRRVSLQIMGAVPTQTLQSLSLCPLLPLR